MVTNMIDKNIDSIKKSLQDHINTNEIPTVYKGIKEKFEHIKNENKYIIYEETSFPYTDVTVIYITDVYDRWCKGYSIARFENKDIHIPRTIHYSDIYVQDKYNKVKIIVEGAHPYDK